MIFGLIFEVRRDRARRPTIQRDQPQVPPRVRETTELAVGPSGLIPPYVQS